MFKKNIAKTLILLTLYEILLASFPSITLAQETGLSVDPSSITGLEIGEILSINITVSDVIDLYAWEFKLFYRNDILDATDMVEGPFLLTHVDPSASTMFGSAPDTTETYNATHGLVHLYNTFVEVEEGVSGSGTLATVTFEVKGEGDCPLSFGETKLVDSAVPFGNLIPHTTTDGVVHVGFHDIAIINMETIRTMTNYTIVYINVTLENQGQVAETFNVTAYYDSVPIETKNVTNLIPSAVTVVTFTWDTETSPKGNYTMSATASMIVGETDTADNEYTDGWVWAYSLGDINGDGKVDILDIAQVAKAFGSKPGDPNWDPNADINYDNQVNILDISTVAIRFGEVDP
jgi:hypothetical protein